ncbi:MAG: response regulator receiver [Gallionellaceae bacterium]|nr:MAG: response regulator receiver [Gallionellaceae bacterium]
MDEMQPVPTPQAAPEPEFTLLFVDDESNILSSLKRLFRPTGYRIFTAESGAQGLEILEREAVDLVVSDMRMPEMSGAQFLEKVRAQWPDTVRILLTGYSEASSTIEAINKGQIYRYISKPWDDNDITLIVRHALQQKQLEREKLRLEDLTCKQNAELKELNANLEDKVRSRTEEVRQAMASLEEAHEKLKKGFITSIRVFSNLIEMRDAKVMGHSRRVAEMSRAIARRMGMSGADTQDVFIAGLLLDVGKIGLPDRLLKKPYANLTSDERLEVANYPVKGQMALMALDQLQDAAMLIRSHRERFDGKGYPDHLAGPAIPLGARILALAKDYDAALIGALHTDPLKPGDALQFIQDGNGKRYDPLVVKAFMSEFNKIGTLPADDVGLALRTEQLAPGMVLARDLSASTGELLLSKEHVLTGQAIEKIRGFERIGGEVLTVHVRARK